MSLIIISLISVPRDLDTLGSFLHQGMPYSTLRIGIDL
jgi:hypothetical protein